MKNENEKIIEDFILTSAIESLKHYFKDYMRVCTKNLNNWHINDEGELQFFGDYLSMYKAEADAREKYEQANKLVIQLKKEYSEVEK